MLKTAAETYSKERCLVGFGFANSYSDAECYFIYSDGNKSEIKTTTHISKFKETLFDPATIKKFKFHIKNEKSKLAG